MTTNQNSSLSDLYIGSGSSRMMKRLPLQSSMPKLLTRRDAASNEMVLPDTPRKSFRGANRCGL
jgi:hypothetical protein